MELIKGRPADETGRLEKKSEYMIYWTSLEWNITEQTMSLLQQWKCAMT